MKYVKMKIIYLAAKIFGDHQSSFASPGRGVTWLALSVVAVPGDRWMAWRDVVVAGKVCFGSSRSARRRLHALCF